jgi:hypothetical protein
MADFAESMVQQGISAFLQIKRDEHDPHGRKKAEVDLKKQQIERAKLDTEGFRDH